jgi:ribonucleotide reductase alpha subunit
MDDSVALINATVADDTEELAMHGSAAEVKLMITRNTDHLELQAEHDWYLDSSVSKTAYTDAVTAGKAYVG